MEHNVEVDIRKAHIYAWVWGDVGQAQGISHRWMVVISVTEHLKQVDHL